jgi:hypothetical protein
MTDNKKEVEFQPLFYYYHLFGYFTQTIFLVSTTLPSTTKL